MVKARVAGRLRRSQIVTIGEISAEAGHGLA
jgi:hypothetical protein